VGVAVSQRFCSLVIISVTDSSRRSKACNSLTSGAVGIYSSGFIAAQKRAINAASTESVLVLRSSFLANPLIRAGLTILTKKPAP
jgi:hypothetical protein